MDHDAAPGDAAVVFPAAGRTRQCSEQLLMTSTDILSDQDSGMCIVQRSSMILSRLPSRMTTQLFAGALKRVAKAGEALFVAGDLVKITATSDRGEERIIALVGALTLTIRQAMNRSRPIRSNRSSLRWTTPQLLSLGGWPDAAV
jgi:hypothetical protein